ncbi:class IV lanthionine synthetase LanL [Streptomyces sp. NPDC001691]|uniref:class IV lanthionine synthetase LanL n=1 Tax=Streptomyces sp. NPDC001691 TaxID=3364600 RepID=UPI0036B78DB7
MTSSYQPILARVLAQAESASPWRVRHRDPWCMVTPAHHVSRRQGWKLHLSATPLSAPDVLENAARVLVAHGCAFKFAATPGLAAEMNAVRAARAQSGKFLTAYPADDDQLRLLAVRLHERTLGLAGPAILSDRRYRPDSLVHYRYGCFARPRELNDEGFYEGRLRAPDGTFVADERNPWFAPPRWAGNPFPETEAASSGRRRGEPVLLADHYLVKEAIRHSNRGGVYRARDEHTGESVLLKEARPHVGAGTDGRDARDWLRHEAAILRRLAPLGITPPVREVFEAGGHVFLAEDLIDGVNLQQWTADRLRTGEGHVLVAEAWCLARELTSMIGRLHAEGLVLRDFKPGNVVMTPDDRPVLVDLECAVRTGTPAPVAGTGGFTAPEYLETPAGPEGAPPAPGPEADCFSLGATLLHVTAGISPVLAPDTPPARPPGERLAALVAAAAPELPALRALAPLVTGLTADGAGRWTLERAAAYLRTGPEGRAGRRPPGGGERADAVARQQPRPSAPVPTAERLLADGLAHLGATMDPAREYLWPGPTALPDGDPCNVQLGAGGVLGVLDRAVRCGHEAAEPALRTAARWLDRRLTAPERVLPGLYFGRSGTAWALYEAATTLEDPALAERAVAYALNIPLDGANPDICHGLSGAGLAQLHLWHATGDGRFAERAARCADGVLRLLHDGPGVDWDAGPEYRAELAGSVCYGFGHGVAGNAAFLLAAGRDLGRPDLTDIAIGGGHALCAVAQWRSGSAHWPKGPGRTERPGLNFWCNGTSGVGSFLVRLWRETGDDRFLEHAEGAARAVGRQRWQVGPGTCHGVAGNAELLLDLHEFTGESRHREAALDLTSCLTVRAARRKGRFLVPDDTLREICASYNVGISGVLDFLLRLVHGGARSWLVDRPARGHHPTPGRDTAHGEPRSGTAGTARNR